MDTTKRCRNPDISGGPHGHLAAHRLANGHLVAQVGRDPVTCAGTGLFQKCWHWPRGSRFQVPGSRFQVRFVTKRSGSLGRQNRVPWEVCKNGILCIPPSARGCHGSRNSREAFAATIAKPRDLYVTHDQPATCAVVLGTELMHSVYEQRVEVLGICDKRGVIRSSSAMQMHGATLPRAPVRTHFSVVTAIENEI